jgi:LysM repeat protein
MDNASFDGTSKNFLFDRVNIYDHQQTFNVNARNVKLDSLVFTDSLKMLTGEGISWKKADIEINLLQGGKKASGPMTVLFKKIQGINTQLYFNNAKSSLSVFLNALSIASIDKKEKLKIDALTTSGKDLYWFGPHTSLTADKFSLTDNYVSSFTNFQFRQTKDNDSVDVKASAIVFTPDVNSVIRGASQIKNTRISDPVIKLRFTEKKDSSREASLPEIFVDQLEMEHPIFSLENSASKGLQKIYWDGTKSNISLKNFTSKGIDNRISIGSLNTTISDFLITNADNKTITSKEGSLKIQLSDMVVNSGKKLFWAATVNQVDAKNFTADSIGKKAANVKVYQGVLKNLHLGSDINGDLKAIIKKNPAFTISDVSGQIIDEKNNWTWHDLSFSKAAKSFSVDSFSFHPVAGRDEFVAANKWQTDYITLKTGKVLVAKFDLDQYLEDSVFRSGNITIDDPYFTSYRDKTPPFHAGIIKPLATKLIQKIPFKVSIDTILVSNGTAVYTELNDKTKETAVIPVTRMSGDIFPIKNFGLTPIDSFRIRLNGYLLDTAWIRLRTRESYLDTLSGFLITVRMQPHSMLYLNQILPALSSIKLQSGYLDTLTMRAVGQEYLSLGEMRMYYHDLKVQFLKNGKEEKKRFLQGLMTFIANSFIVKNENKKRVGVVYFPRSRDRSFINYYIKIVMSGVASSVGAKKNKRLMKKYNKQLKTRQLPPIDFD